MQTKELSKTVLVVDDEKLFLASLTEGMKEYEEDFSLITAANGKKALSILRSRDIHLVVTDLKMPVMDGFQLLGHMLNEFPHIPVIVMTAFLTPDIEKQVQGMETFELLEKPVDLKLLASKIRNGIQHASEGHLKGIMLFSFLQLLEMERKTCVLRVKTASAKGNLYFSDGVLIDAVYEALVGLDAAKKIVCWENAEIEILSIPKKIRKRIDTPLQNILMDAAKEKDESSLSPDDDPLDLNEPDLELPPLESSSPAKGQTGGNKKEPEAEKRSPETKPNNNGSKIMSSNLQSTLQKLMETDGALGCALVDSNSGMALGVAGGGLDLDVAAAGSSQFVKTGEKVLGLLGIQDNFEDILLTLSSTQYHLIRPMKSNPVLFFYLALDKSKSNLAMARFRLSEAEGTVEI